MDNATLHTDAEPMSWHIATQEWEAGLRDYLKDCQPKFRDKPHPDSYGADLPLRSQMVASDPLPSLFATTPTERKHYAARPLRIQLTGFSAELKRARMTGEIERDETVRNMATREFRRVLDAAKTFAFHFTY